MSNSYESSMKLFRVLLTNHQGMLLLLEGGGRGGVALAAAVLTGDITVAETLPVDVNKKMMLQVVVVSM